MPSSRFFLALVAPLTALAAVAAGCATGGAVGLGGDGGSVTTTGPTSSSASSAGGGAGGAGGAVSSSTSASSTSSSTSASSSTTSASSSASSTTSASSSASSSSTSASSSTSGGTCALNHLVISEVRSRGLGGASDEFVELYNPTGAAVTLDDTWKLEGRSTTAASYNSRWLGGPGKTIPAHGHFLLAYTGYVQMPVPDGMLTSGITDATCLRLVQSGTTVDAVCYAPTAAMAQVFLDDATFTREGVPANNPNSGDASLERKPGGAGGNCTDTGDNASDFADQMPSTPMSSASPPTP